LTKPKINRHKILAPSFSEEAKNLVKEYTARGYEINLLLISPSEARRRILTSKGYITA
jgi:hypothetical protein